jgi:energy-converting hydrogenase Eha subunit E
MILITMILTTMDFMVLGGTVGAVDGGEDPVVGTMDEEEDIEVEGVMDLMDPMVEGLEEEVEAEAEVVEVEEAEEVEEVVVNHTSMIFLTYSQTLCTCQLTDLNFL